jgi:pyrroline-5-carboxylate reductase
VKRIAILGGGNLGRALAAGWAGTDRLSAGDITITRRQADKLQELVDRGFDAHGDNPKAVAGADTIVLAVQPQQLDALAAGIKDALEPARHCVISAVSGVTIARIREVTGGATPVVRAMPNTAVAIGESMTCLAGSDGDDGAVARARDLFDLLGETLIIPEEMMTPATALCACGVAFFLRCVRAASQGGIEIGFHPDEALLLAAQTAKGAASLLLENGGHPEAEIDRVTTPRGCTIAGLNEMEHRGFSSAMIKAILVSARKAGKLDPAS